MDVTVLSNYQPLKHDAFVLLCPLLKGGEQQGKKGHLSKVASAGRSVPTSTKGPSEVRQHDIMIFICLYSNFLLWGKESYEGPFGQRSQGSERRESLTKNCFLLLGYPSRIASHSSVV